MAVWNLSAVFIHHERVNVSDHTSRNTSHIVQRFLFHSLRNFMRLCSNINSSDVSPQLPNEKQK